MDEFTHDVVQRRRIASGAAHRVNGSKSRACTLPSDYLTEAQRKALNGEVKSFNINMPMSWRGFRNLEDSQRKLYLDHLFTNYNPTINMLAEMLGISRATLTNFFAEKGIHSPRRRGARVTPADRLRWRAFCGSASSGSERCADFQLEVTEPQANVRYEEEPAACAESEPQPCLDKVDFLTGMNITVPWKDLPLVSERFSFDPETPVTVVVYRKEDYIG